MTLQLSGNVERGKNQYESFEGRPIDTMPVLIEQGYDPASIAVIFNRRLNTPEEVIEAWRNQYFWTADGASTDQTGCAVLTLDAQPLRTIDSKSNLYQGALQLSRDEFDALKLDDSSVILSAQEVEDAHRSGVRKQKGLWLPVNLAVAKALGHYLRGTSFEDKDFQTYAQMVSDASGGREEVLFQYFDRSKPSKPHLRSVVVGRTDGYSFVSGSDLLLNYDGRLAGVAPEALDAKNLGSTKTPSRNKLVDALYQHFQNVPLADGVTKKGLNKLLRKYL